MPGDLPKTGELTTGQREARQPGKAKRGRVKAHNAIKAREAYMRCFDGGIGHDDWVRAKPCPFCKVQETHTQAAHATARGMGAAKGRWYVLFPACQCHHDEQGAEGNEHMAHKYGVCPTSLARACTGQHLRELGAIR